MSNHVVQIALLQISIMMFMSAIFMAFWIYFYMAYEAISDTQMYGYYVLWAVCGTNFFVLGPFGLAILLAKVKIKCITRTTLFSYIIMCLVSLAPTPLLSNVFGKGEATRAYIREFYFANGRVPYLMDYIQRSQHCCGLNNYTDYYRTPEAEEDDEALNEPVPLSCCTEIVMGCEKSIGLTYKQGCFVTPGTNNALMAWEHPFHGTGFLAVVLIPMILPLFQFLPTCFLHDAFVQLSRKCSRKEKRRRESRNSVINDEGAAGDATGISPVREAESSFIGGYSPSSSSNSDSSSSSSSKSSSGSQRSSEPLLYTVTNLPAYVDDRRDPELSTLFKMDDRRSEYSSNSRSNSKDGDSGSGYSERSEENSLESNEPSQLFVTEEDTLNLVSGFFDLELLSPPIEEKRKNDRDERQNYKNGNDRDKKQPEDDKSSKGKPTERENPPVQKAPVGKPKDGRKSATPNSSEAGQSGEEMQENNSGDSGKSSKKRQSSDVRKENTRNAHDDRKNDGGGGRIKPKGYISVAQKDPPVQKSDRESIKSKENKTIASKSPKSIPKSNDDSIKTVDDTTIAQKYQPVQKSVLEDKSETTPRSKVESSKTEKSKYRQSGTADKSNNVQEPVKYNYQPEVEVTYTYTAAPSQFPYNTEAHHNVDRRHERPPDHHQPHTQDHHAPPPHLGDHHGYHPPRHNEHHPIGHYHPPTFHSGGSDGHHGTGHSPHRTGHHGTDHRHETHHHHQPQHGHHDGPHHHGNQHHVPPHHNHHEPHHHHDDHRHDPRHRGHHPHDHGHNRHGGNHHARQHHR